jgi:hypothetical protein
MINCEFVQASSFKFKRSNQAKLLYFYMICSADDKGFVDNVDELIELLTYNDTKFKNNLQNTFEQSIKELVDKALLIRFNDNHGNSIYLIKHWFMHNVIPKERLQPSTYERYLKGIELTPSGEYNVLQVYSANEYKVKESNINNNNINDEGNDNNEGGIKVSLSIKDTDIDIVYISYLDRKANSLIRSVVDNPEFDYNRLIEWLEEVDIKSKNIPSAWFTKVFPQELEKGTFNKVIKPDPPKTDDLPNWEEMIDDLEPPTKQEEVDITNKDYLEKVEKEK